MSTLNGWQRLFVVLSALAFVPVLGVAAFTYERQAPSQEIEAQLVNPLCVRFATVYDAKTFEAKGTHDKSYGAVNHATRSPAETRKSTYDVSLPDGTHWVARFNGDIGTSDAEPIAWRATWQARESKSFPVTVLPTGLRIANVPKELSDRELLEKVLRQPERSKSQILGDRWPECAALVSYWIDSGIAVLDPAHYRKAAREAATRTAVEEAMTAIAAWAALCASLYVAGWSVAWIRRGFRESRP